MLAPLVQGAALADSAFRAPALFYHGAACFRLGDDMAAGRSLGVLVSSPDPAFGAAARLLLGAFTSAATSEPRRWRSTRRC